MRDNKEYLVNAPFEDSSGRFCFGAAGNYERFLGFVPAGFVSSLLVVIAGSNTSFQGFCRLRMCGGKDEGLNRLKVGLR